MLPGIFQAVRNQLVDNEGQPFGVALHRCGLYIEPDLDFFGDERLGVGFDSLFDQQLQIAVYDLVVLIEGVEPGII
ncbi:hypothetical protein D3C75_1211710 [compost metagenome]